MSPNRVGICGFELYFPKMYVSQEDLEEFYTVTKGKYTQGFEQERMGFCADHEDIVSVCMTAVSALLRNYKVSTSSVGFLAVGTETLIDKSKSVKTALMELFDDNHDIEGVDVKNACYGGTQALFHAVDWVTANWEEERKYAVVVMGDIAVYEPGPARCTGGAGACALLVGPYAFISLEKGQRASYMTNAWDFYKPICSSVTEYPIVEGVESLRSYYKCLDGAYKAYRQKRSLMRETGSDFAGLGLSEFKAVLFHCPFAKLVRKAFAFMSYLDYLAGNWSSEKFDALKRNMTKEELLNNREFWTASLSVSRDQFEIKTGMFLLFSKLIGNMYTASLYSQLIALIHFSSLESLLGSRVLFFSYGSGAAASVFSVHVDDTNSGGMLQQFNAMKKSANDAVERLAKRVKVTPHRYTEILLMREKLLKHSGPYTPEAIKLSEKDEEFRLFPGTFYLHSIDEKYRRHYKQTELSCSQKCLV